MMPTPVDYDPFAGGPTSGAPTPVDYDPFAASPAPSRATGAHATMAGMRSFAGVPAPKPSLISGVMDGMSLLRRAAAPAAFLQSLPARAVTAYAPKAQVAPRGGVADVAQSGLAGLLNASGGLADAAGAAAGFGAPFAPGAFASLAGLEGGDYQPGTTAGRYSKAVGEFAPNLFMPGSEGLGVLRKIAQVALPAIASQGATDVAARLHAPRWLQAVAGTAGAVAGGGLASVGGTGAPAPLSAPAKAVQTAMSLTDADPADVSAALGRGQLPVAAGAPGLTQLGENVAQSAGAGAPVLKAAIAERVAGDPDRIMDAVTNTLGVDPAAARGNVETVVKNGRAAVAPIYADIEARTDPVWSADLASLAQRPAIKKAAGLVANDMLNEGKSPTTAGISLDPDTGWKVGAPGEAPAIEQQPLASTWVRIHQALGRTVDRNPITNAPLPDSVSAGNAGINAASRDLRTALAGDPANGVAPAIPGYAEGLSGSSDYLSASNAFNRAKGSLFRGPVSDFTSMWGSLNGPGEQGAARAGLANDVLEMADRGQLTPGKFKAPGVQQKLQTAFGPQAGDFIDQMEQAAQERQTYGEIVGNSRTQMRQSLAAAYQKKPGVSPGAVAETLLSLTHPAILATKVARAGVGAMSKPPVTPWADAATNAQLGQILADPKALQAVLDQIQAFGAAKAAASAQNAAALRNAPRLAVPAIVTAADGR